LGGAFFSRLNKEIRVKKGLTYGASSYFIPRLDNGPFLVETYSRHEKVGETLKTAFSVMESFKKDGVTDQEVNEAKGFLKGAITQIIATPEDLARNLIVLDMYGIPESYLSNYIKNVEAISTSDVNKVIKKYFDPENLDIIIFGSKAKAYHQVKDLGTIKVQSYQSFL
jgi:zinc protease